jgi:transcriptional regulator GlxA family with amidase domain
MMVDIKHAGIARSVRFMARHFFTPIRVTDLMMVAGLSRRGFLKSFQKHVGDSPGNLLRRMRIEYSKRLLADGDRTLADVATASGFRKVNSFYVAFRSLAGVAPRKFQRQARTGNNGCGGEREPISRARSMGLRGSL